MAEVTNDDANDLADEILSREEFLGAQEPGFFERNVDRALEAIFEFLGDLFGAIFGGAGGGAGTALAYILLGLAAAVLIYAIYKALSDRESKPDDDEEAGPRIVFDEVVEPTELREQLRRHRASSDWRQAVIAGFRLAVVGLIDARGSPRDRRGNHRRLCRSRRGASSRIARNVPPRGRRLRACLL